MVKGKFLISFANEETKSEKVNGRKYMILFMEFENLKEYIMNVMLSFFI